MFIVIIKKPALISGSLFLTSKIPNPIFEQLFSDRCNI